MPKPNNNQQIVEHMENLSKTYFRKIFPSSTISIEPKAKSMKQGGHVVIVKSEEGHPRLNDTVRIRPFTNNLRWKYG